jgi:hypothetical protein
MARLEHVLMFGSNCIDPSGRYIDVEEAGIGWVIDDARKPPVFSEEEQELRELALLANHS